MPKLRTYVDTGVLMAAFQGKESVGKNALEILDDPSRCLILSDAVLLELMPKPCFEKRQEEIDFYNEVVSNSECLKWQIEVLDSALYLAKDHGIAAMDAIHIAMALNSKVDEFVTLEKTSKPMFRMNTRLNMRSIHS